MSAQEVAPTGVSVIVPTWNRSVLLDAMLASLAHEREVYPGETEVIVVDSSEGDERQRIEESCARYNARLLSGEQNVRRKRNLGVSQARYPLLLFLDSDVVVEPGLIQTHVDAYSRPGVRVGAAQGLTEFVGHGGFWWHVAELSGLTDSFSNARKYPFQSWSITNNLSVRRDVFEEVGRFRDDFPFKLGGDDLEMSYRIAHAGYMIASAPGAVALHSKETWDRPQALLDRTKRWGFMESRICDLHPELYKFSVPKTYVFALPILILFMGAACLGGGVAPASGALVLFSLLAFQRYSSACRVQGRLVNPIHLLIAVLFSARYECFRLAGHLSLGRRTAFAHTMVFNHYQARESLAGDSARLKRLFLNAVAACLVAGVIAYVL